MKKKNRKIFKKKFRKETNKMIDEEIRGEEYEV